MICVHQTLKYKRNIKDDQKIVSTGKTNLIEVNNIIVRSAEGNNSNSVRNVSVKKSRITYTSPSTEMMTNETGKKSNRFRKWKQNNQLSDDNKFMILVSLLDSICFIGFIFYTMSGRISAFKYFNELDTLPAKL